MVNTEKPTKKSLGPLALAAMIIEGCGSARPLDTAAAIVTAPIIAPIMIFEARRNDPQAALERLRRNDGPLPVLDETSQHRARTALRQVLEEGTLERRIGWENANDRNGPTGEELMVVATRTAHDGAACHDVLIERLGPHGTSHQRVRTYCQAKEEWLALPAPK